MSSLVRLQRTRFRPYYVRPGQGVWAGGEHRVAAGRVQAPPAKQAATWSRLRIGEPDCEPVDLVYSGSNIAAGLKASAGGGAQHAAESAHVLSPPPPPADEPQAAPSMARGGLDLLDGSFLPGKRSVARHRWSVLVH